MADVSLVFNGCVKKDDLNVNIDLHISHEINVWFLFISVTGHSPPFCGTRFLTPQKAHVMNHTLNFHRQKCFRF